VSESERRAGLAARTCDPARTRVIHNGVALDGVAPAALDGAPPVLVSVGRLAAPKDPLTLVTALACLPPGVFRAVLVGGGPEHAAVADAVHRAGLDGVVELVGDRDDVPALLAAGDLFVLASRSEGFPMSVLEAMAAGLPVVASAVGGVCEAVVDGETGLLVPPGDAGALAGAIERLLADGRLRREMGSAGRARAAAHFGLERFAAEHVQVYERALAEAPKRRRR
jgi:glycosyltransferase involved in cell wall biosynthesis